VSKHTYTIVLEILLRDLISIIENEIIDIRYIYCINCKHRLRKNIELHRISNIFTNKKCIFDTLTDIYTHTYTHTHTHMCGYIHTYTYTHIHTHTYIYMYVCIYLHVCMCVCVRVYSETTVFLTKMP
ncbi:unnamed protein product, partial [Meganyctiphanes norvegica]